MSSDEQRDLRLAAWTNPFDARITLESERKMNGAIAAGHPLTAEAGAGVLRARGSAVDACVAAALVSWVCESPLTGPGGGGFRSEERRGGRGGVGRVGCG